MPAYAFLGHTTATTVNAGTLAAASDNAFGKSTVNVLLSDASSFLTLSATNTWTHAATGNYQIDGVVGYGYDHNMNGVSVRAGLYNVTGGSFAVNVGGSNEIISTPGVAPDPGGASTGTSFVQVQGIYTVASTSDHYGIYMAGKPGATTWFSSSFAQGAAAAGVTNGSKPEVYKQIQITQV